MSLAVATHSDIREYAHLCFKSLATVSTHLDSSHPLAMVLNQVEVVMDATDDIGSDSCAASPRNSGVLDVLCSARTTHPHVEASLRPSDSSHHPFPFTYTSISDDEESDDEGRDHVVYDSDDECAGAPVSRPRAGTRAPDIAVSYRGTYPPRSPNELTLDDDVAELFDSLDLGAHIAPVHAAGMTRVRHLVTHPAAWATLSALDATCLERRCLEYAVMRVAERVQQERRAIRETLSRFSTA